MSPKTPLRTPTMNKIIDADISGFAGFFTLISTVSRAVSFRVMNSVVNTMLLLSVISSGNEQFFLPEISQKVSYTDFEITNTSL